MADEAAFSVTKQYHTIRGDSLAEFQQNVEAILGAGSYQRVVSSYQEAFGISADTGFAQATQVLQEAGLNPQAIPAPVSTIGNPAPLPQPGVVPQPVAAPALPPTVSYPGDCVHGARVYKDSQARGKAWQRWECASPWVKGNDAHNAQRCKAVNV